MDATASDSDGTISRVEFYSGTSKVGERTAAPYSWTLSSIAAGTYSLRAAAQDDRGATSWSNEVQVTVVAGNQAPTVSLTSPKGGTVFHAPTNLTVAASATDADGSIDRVEFFADATLIGTVTTAPFAIEWRDVAPGAYNLSAVAFDNFGASTTSAAVKINVNAPPSVTVSARSTTILAGETLLLEATASDPGGSVRRVEFYSGSVLLGKDMNVPYRFNWSKARAGTWVITAVAYDNLGASTRSAPITVTVIPSGQAPVLAAVLPKVQPLGADYDGAFELQLEGQSGDIYDVWYSADLKTWSLLISVLNSEGVVTVSDYTANTSSARFYRVSLQ